MTDLAFPSLSQLYNARAICGRRKEATSGGSYTENYGKINKQEVKKKHGGQILTYK